HQGRSHDHELVRRLSSRSGTSSEAAGAGRRDGRRARPGARPSDRPRAGRASPHPLHGLSSMSDERPDLGIERLTRRRFLEAGALSAVASVLPGCGDPPPEHIVPYVERPLEVTPGVSRYYATAALRAGVAVGVLAESREGRPIKIEGNPEHPSSLGATGPVEQALSYTLYGTDRLQGIRHKNAPASFDALARALSGVDGLHLWLPATSSPLIEALLARVMERAPGARISFDPS